MTNFEFKSAVCTTKEQSQKLLALGLKKETADMYHDLSTGITEVPYTEVELQRELEKNDTLPAWSLHRLLIMYRDNYSFFSLDNAYDELIDAIAIDIEKGTFKKDYLEEKK